MVRLVRPLVYNFKGCGARVLFLAQDCWRLSPSTTSRKNYIFFKQSKLITGRDYGSPTTLYEMFPIANPYAVAYSEKRDEEELVKVKEQTFDVVSRITGLFPSPLNYCRYI